MRKKAAITGTWLAIIAAVLAIALLIVGILIVFKVKGEGSKISELSPKQGDLCKVKQKLGPILQLTGGPNDFDNDGWDDSCDWCICSPGQGCNNNPVGVEGGDDRDGDGLPGKCDENDDPAKGGRSVLEFHKKNCVPKKTYFERQGMAFCYPK